MITMTHMDSILSSNPKVTAILVNYNGYKDTVECVKSLENIEYDNLDIVMVDNGSVDKPTGEQELYLKEHTIYVETNRNMGFSGGNNVGIRMAIENQSSYVLLLNNDTVVTPDFLKIMVDAAAQLENVGVIGGKIKYYNRPDVIWYGGGSYDFRKGDAKHWQCNQKDNVSLASIQEVSFITGCLMLIPISVINQIGLLEEEYFLYAEDTEFCCRILRNNLKLFYCPEAVIYHKVSASTGATSYSTQYYMVRNNLFVVKKYGTNRIYAYLLHLIRAIVRIIKRKLSLYPVVCAWKDFLFNKKGIWKESKKRGEG